MFDRYQQKRFTYAFICFTFAGLLFVIDYTSVESPIDRMTRNNPPNVTELSGMRPYPDNSRFWEVNIGNGFVSNVESMLFLISGLYGGMLVFDVIYKNSKG